MWTVGVASYNTMDHCLVVTCEGVASYPGLLTPAFVTCSTNAGEAGLVKLSHVV